MEEIISWVTGIIAAASIIANITPSDSDNKIIAKITKAVQLLALNLKK